MVYQIDGYSIAFPNGKRHRFHDLIVQIVEFEDVLVLRLETHSLHRTNENVFAIDFHGNMLWQIPPRIHLNEFSPCVGLYRRGDMIDAYNWDGNSLTIHPLQGTILSEGSITPGPGRRPRPTKSYF